MEQNERNLSNEEMEAIRHYYNVPFEMRFFLYWALKTLKVTRGRDVYGIKLGKETYYIDLFSMEEYLQTLDIADRPKAKAIRDVCERADKEAR